LHLTLIRCDCRHFGDTPFRAFQVAIKQIKNAMPRTGDDFKDRCSPPRRQGLILVR
jgi:hypothetical protein